MLGSIVTAEIPPGKVRSLIPVNKATNKKRRGGKERDEKQDTFSQ